MKKIYICFIMMLLACNIATAQDYMMTAMGETPQRNQINPAYMPRASFLTVPFVGALSISAENPFNYNALFDKGNINSSYLMRRTRNNNPMLVKAGVDLFSFGIRFRENQMITASNQLRVSAGFNYPHDVFAFVFDNPLLSNRSFDISMNGRMMAWDETAVGYSIQIDNHWSVGAKMKFLLGAAALNTGNSRIMIDKQLDAYTVRGDVDIMLGNYDARNNQFGTSTIMNNPGVAFDIGAMYNSKRGWRVGVSLTDMGFINWNAGNSSRIVSRSPDKVYHFEGLGDLSDVFESGNVADLLDSVYHDIMDVMEIDTLSGVRGKTTLPITMNISGEYDVRGDNMHMVSMNMLGMFSQRKRFNYAFTAGYRYTTRNGKFSVIGTLTHKNTDPMTLGAGIMTNTQGFQFYILADGSLTGLASVGNLRSVGFRWGFNCYLGKYRSGKINQSVLW